MKYAGKITLIGLICLILALGITWTVTQQAKATTIASQTFVLPSSPTVTYNAATYIMLYDRSTGNLIDGDDGTDNAAWSAVGAAIETAPHATNTEVWTATIPALSSSVEYVMVIWTGANYAATDTFQAGPFLYDPEQNITYSDTNPIRRKNVGVRAQ